MTDHEKNVGIPIEDDELDGVAGGVSVLPGAEEIQQLLKSGEPITVTAPTTTINTRVLTSRDVTPGTVEPLNTDVANRAEEFLHGIEQARQFKK